LIATHLRSRCPGERRTVLDHMPPEARAFFARDRSWCLQQARTIGPFCAELIEHLLGDRIVERLRGAQGVLSLAKRMAARAWKQPAGAPLPTPVPPIAPSSRSSSVALIDSRSRCRGPTPRRCTAETRGSRAMRRACSTPRTRRGIEHIDFPTPASSPVHSLMFVKPLEIS
jgi:hypothetical protein